MHIGPLWPYAVLIGIPAVAFILPDILGGHLLMTGDNLQQNYPLHVLVGSMYRHGELPFWNRYLFSGTPLLAGFNAGAFYPLIGLFAILPDRMAWIATEVILFSLIAIGMYLFLRALKLSTIPCVLAAIAFSFSGVVLSQVNHVDMSEGFASLPFMLLAVVHIVRDGRWRWSVLLGVAFALVILGGAPEAMLDEAFLVIAYAALCAGLDRPSWRRVLTRCGGGAALALALAAVQWLPGIAAISQFPTLGARRLLHGLGELCTRQRTAVGGALLSSGATATSGRRSSSRTTTCPRSASTSGSFRSSRCSRSGIRGGRRAWPGASGGPGTSSPSSGSSSRSGPTPPSSMSSTKSRSTAASVCRAGT